MRDRIVPPPFFPPLCLPCHAVARHAAKADVPLCLPFFATFPFFDHDQDHDHDHDDLLRAHGRCPPVFGD